MKDRVLLELRPSSIKYLSMEKGAVLYSILFYIFKSDTQKKTKNKIGAEGVF